MKQVYSLLVLTVAVCLSHAASFSGSMPKDAERSVSGRYRRGTSSLTETEIKAVVDQHNALRAAEGASNMELMVWNDELASMADTWAAGCRFDHGQPPVQNPPFPAIGQNLHMTGGQINLATAIQSWYHEKNYYNYDTLQCAPGRACGHYTQVVWASSREIGCGYQFCPTVPRWTTNAYILVCNYGPGGNMPGQKPYTKGPACTKCESGAGWCKFGLCNRKCTSAGADCSCVATCYNCATLDSSKCRCWCADGWQGADCSEVCKDLHPYCNAGWPAFTCTNYDFSWYIRKQCRAMCGLCTPDATAVPNRCPPVTLNQ